MRHYRPAGNRLRASLRRGVAAGAAALLAVAGLSLGAVLPAEAAQAAPATGSPCNFASAGTGTFANTVCWFDLASYASAASESGQPMTVAIPGGYTMTYTLTVTGGAVRATTFPTYSGAYLGNNGHYSGIAGSPALYQRTGGTTTTATLSDISVTSATGVKETGFALVGADAESTDPGESITWNSTSPIASLTASGASAGIGNACSGGFTGVGTTNVTCKGGGGASKTGTAILASANPTTFSQTMVGGGLQAVAFGVLVSSVQVDTKVVDGFAGDSFGSTIANRAGTVLGSANTNGSASASTGKQTVIVSTDGTTFGLSQQITSGLASNYTTIWSCTRNGRADPTLPSGAVGYDQQATLGVGDSVLCTITNTAKTAALGLVKHAGTPVDVNGDGLTDAGDTIPYTFTVTNLGALPLSRIAIADAKVGSVTCAATTLAPGASTICAANAPSVVTAADDTHGSVDNSATASGFPPGVTTAVTSAPSTTSTPAAAPAPALTVEKSGTPSDAAAYQTGQVVTYSFVVTNTGNVRVSGVATDESAFSGTGALTPATCPAGAASVAPGAQVTCTATYTLTQADVNAGHVSNSATATGTAPDGTTVTSPVATAQIPVVAAPAVSLIKTVSPTTATGAGQTVTYGYALTNTGNVTLTDPAVTESAAGFSGTGPLPVATCPAGPLLPGATVDCTAPYALTQADADAGTVTNTATASATAPGGATVTSAGSSASVTITPAPALSLVKSSTVPDGAVAGDTVDYAFVVRNTGNVTVSAIAVAEGSFSGTGALTALECPATALAPGQTSTCTATYSLTQADVDAGTVTNTATATGTSAGGAAVASAPSAATTPTDREAALTVVKSADRTTVAAVGDTIGYSYLVTNTGTVTLLAPTITETAFSGAGTEPAADCGIGLTLAPAQSTTCTATYTVTQADLGSRSIVNTATATADPPSGMEAPVSAPASASVAVEHSAAVVDETADVTTVDHAGEIIDYRLAIVDTGTTTLTDPALSDTTFSGTGRLGPLTCPATPASLLPGQEVVCTASYTVAPGDLTGRPLIATARASIVTPNGPIVTPLATLRIATVARAAVAPAGSVPAPGAGTPLGAALAFTGSDPGRLVGLAAALLAVGALVLFARRVRRRS